MTTYGDRKEKIRAILLQHAREGRTIYYKELGSLVRIPTAGPWKPVLDEISREERSKNLPDITYLVVSKKSGFPGQIEFNPAIPATADQKLKAKDVIAGVFSHYEKKKPK